MISNLFTMVLLFSTPRVAFAFRASHPTFARNAAAAACTTKSTTQVQATFLENLAKGFSTITDNTAASSTKSKYYTVAISGSGGLVGTALRDELGKRETVNGKPVRVIRLVRGKAAESKDLVDDDDADATTTTLTWNPNGSSPEDVIDPSVLAKADAVIHLSGENIATGQGPLGFLGLRPWSDAKKEEIVKSRTVTTSALAKAIAASSTPTSFLVASGIGVYGYDYVGDSRDAVDESMDVSNTDGFLAEVSRQWEAAANGAKDGKNNRVVNMRFGVVMSTKGGALQKLYPIFFLGGGGNVGSGQQYFSYISARDLARAIVHTLETPSLDGPVNFAAPDLCTNAQFTQALGKAMGRPTILPFPGFAVSLLFGEMGEETLLGGIRAKPTKLLNSGFEFLHPTVDEAVTSALKEKI